MPQSLHQVFGHLVFSTKDRVSLIHGEIEKDLYAFVPRPFQGPNRFGAQQLKS